MTSKIAAQVLERWLMDRVRSRFAIYKTLNDYEKGLCDGLTIALKSIIDLQDGTGVLSIDDTRKKLQLNRDNLQRFLDA